MGPAVVSYHFRRPPSTIRYYPRAVFGRRAALVPEGRSVPRLEGRVESVATHRSHLTRYQRVCGFEDGDALPITYPHVLAMPLHVALLTHPLFPVRLMGLIHVANEIDQARPLRSAGEYGIRSWIEGHRDADRGHEFELFTEVDDRDGAAWREKSTLLARRASDSRRAARSARRTLSYERPADGDATADVDFEAPRAVGRSYGWLSGDLNPIHLGDRGARLFGFDRAVAHGMWSMARSLAALGPDALTPPVGVHVEFKLPLFLPGAARLTHWPREGRRLFVLKDADSGRPHLAGTTLSS
jgi:acyl dehydratase